MVLRAKFMPIELNLNWGKIWVVRFDRKNFLRVECWREGGEGGRGEVWKIEFSFEE
jgi:hypothetical protein